MGCRYMLFDISWMGMRGMDIFANAGDIAAAQGRDPKVDLSNSPSPPWFARRAYKQGTNEQLKYF